MKVLLLSHIADPDGIMPVILTDLVFDDYEYKLFEPSDLNNYMLDALQNNELDKYDYIFITDLCVNEEVALEITNSRIKDKIIILDHHISSISLNKYPFIHVIDEQDGIKESGTSLYYKYLLEHYPNPNLLHNSVSYMVSLVRLGDTWEWKKYNNLDARKIGTLLNYYGIDKFIDNYKKFLRENEEFYFTNAENLLIEIDERRRNEYIDNLKDKVIIRKIDNLNVGIVFAELYRSELGNALAEYYHDEVDLILIVNLNRSLSFRSLEDKADVNSFATTFNGKGHTHAAGAPIPEHMKDYIIDYLINSRNVNENR